MKDAIPRLQVMKDDRELGAQTFEFGISSGSGHEPNEISSNSQDGETSIRRSPAARTLE